MDREALRAAYRDVEGLEPEVPFSGSGWNQVEKEDWWPDPVLVWLTLAECLECPSLSKPIEKSLWIIGLRIRNVDLLLEHGKFGLKAHVRGSDGGAEALEGVLRRVKRTQSIVEKLLDAVVEERVRRGEVTICNDLWALTSRYRYFRERAEDLFAQAGPGESWFSGDVNAKIGLRSEGHHNAVAAVDAYFSRLEHLMVLLAAFAGFDPATEDLAAFITNCNWDKKLLRVVPLRDAVDDKRYRALRRVKEAIRNPSSHGGFHRNERASLLVHSRVGAIPATLRRDESGMSLRLRRWARETFEEVFEVLDDCDAWISERHPLGIAFAEAGLDVAFNCGSLEEYVRAMEKPEEFEKYLDYKRWQKDNAANMDW